MRLLLLISFIFLVSCSDMKPEDFKNTKPVIKIEEYFQGPVKAWGLLQDRKGNVTTVSYTHLTLPTTPYV